MIINTNMYFNSLYIIIIIGYVFGIIQVPLTFERLSRK